jgi:acyl transferase domain-containing protein/thioesterase domain-containing protein
MRAADLDGAVRRLVLGRLREWYGVDPAHVPDDRPLAELGVASRDAVTLAAQLSELAEVRLPATLLWEAPSLRQLVRRVRAAASSAAEAGAGTAATRANTGRRARSGPEPVEIAVVGIGCRLPGGVTSAEGYWELLRGGTDAVGTLPDGRWDDFALPDDPALAQANRCGGFLDDVAGFDAEFFGIAPSEAAAMDPQQRLLLEVAREGLDHAAIPAAALAGTRTGVYVGISGNEYAHLTTRALDRIEAWTAPGAALSIAANRLSYALDLRGPSLAVDTACSSSLVAVHHAVRALVSGECDTALAGGVNVLLSPALTLGFQRAGALAPDGRCKTFDAAADGMVRAEGCAVIVLRRLADAQRNGDRVLAVILGSAVNSDGRSNGLLAPSAEAQRDLLAELYSAPGSIPAAEVDYVEAHGTGTVLGDPVEASALGAVLGRGREPDQPLLLGSVKTNLGHLEAAAGIAGLIKTVLALHHDQLPPHLHFATPNPHIDFDALRLRVVTDPEPWPRYSGTATAGVSAFGFGGTNAHILVQEYRTDAGPVDFDPCDPVPAVLPLDAPTPARLREDAADLASWLAAQPPYPVLTDVAHTLAGRTGRGRHRAAVVARTREQAAEALIRLSGDQPHPALVTGSARSGGPGPVWVFSGYGSQWAGMARRLLDDEPVFAAAVARLEPLLMRHAGISLRAHLEPDADLTRPGAVQPVLFGLQVALAELWRSCGQQPAAVIGHSMGEVAAAVVAGSLSERDGARVIAVRSHLLDGLTGGAMAAVDRSPAEIAELADGLMPSVEIAVHASPQQCVVAGSAQDIERLIALVTAEGGTARPLGVVGAGHTSQVDALLGPLAQRLGEIGVREPSCPMYTTVDQDPRARLAPDTAHWVRNLRSPVRFRQAVEAAAQDGHRVFVEISPHPTQLYPLGQTLAGAEVGTEPQDRVLMLPTLRRGPDETQAFRLSLAMLLVHGFGDPAAARRALHPGARIVDPPSARWRHQRYWATSPVPRAVPTAADVTSQSLDASAAPATTIDRLLACIAQVTGYPAEGVDVHAPLTDFGLDSLQAARIVALARSEFGIDVPPRVLLRQGTVAKIAAYVDGGEAAQAAAPPVPRGVLPRDAVERLVARLVQTVTGHETAGVETVINGLRHDVPAVTALARALGDELGQTVPPSRLFGPAPEPVTIASIAERIRPLMETAEAEPVRVFRARGARPPLYLIHPAGGSSAVYRTLARRLGDEQPCFGLERLPHLAEVTERAAEYVRLIRAAHPHGPWAVGGWSYGGLVGQETARLLARHGTVSALILIDSVLPLPAPDHDPQAEALRRFAGFSAYVEQVYDSPLPLPYDELAVLDDASQIELVVKLLQQTVDLPPPVLHHQRDSYLDLRSGERHSPAPYPGRTLLYRATEAAPHTVRDTRYERADDALGWQDLCPDLHVRHVSGHHLNLLDPPAVDPLSRLLDADLG